MQMLVNESRPETMVWNMAISNPVLEQSSTTEYWLKTFQKTT